MVGQERENGLNMRVRLRGINSKRKQLADGSWRTYYWAWKGGPPLRSEPGTPEFVASYNEAIAQKLIAPTPRSASASYFLIAKAWKKRWRKAKNTGNEAAQPF